MKLRVSLINLFPSKNKENSVQTQKEAIRKLCGGFIGVPERTKTTQISKRHLMQLRINFDNLKDAISKH